MVEFQIGDKVQVISVNDRTFKFLLNSVGIIIDRLDFPVGCYSIEFPRTLNWPDSILGNSYICMMVDHNITLAGHLGGYLYG